MQAHLFELSEQHGATRGIELHVHHVRLQVHHMHLEAAIEQASCGFQAEEAAADDGCATGMHRALEHALAVVERAKDECARLECAGRLVEESVHPRHETTAAGGNHQRVVGFDQAVSTLHAPAAQVDVVSAHARMKHDAAAGIPVERIDHDVARMVRTGQHARQQDPVVVAVRFVAEHRHVETIAAAAGQYVLHQPRACHAVADHDQPPLRAHSGASDRNGSTRTAQTLNSGIRLVGSSAGLVRRFTDCSPPQ